MNEISQTRQEHDLAIWKFQRIVIGGDPFFIDLPQDRRLVFDQLIRATVINLPTVKGLASHAIGPNFHGISYTVVSSAMPRSAARRTDGRKLWL